MVVCDVVQIIVPGGAAVKDIYALVNTQHLKLFRECVAPLPVHLSFQRL
jgi:hypothetical protein